MAIEFFEESNVGTRTLPRSVATRAGGFVFVSGQIGRDDNGVIVTGGIEAHTRQTMENVAHALALAGCALEDVVKVTVWLDDARDFADFNRVYAEFFPGNRPARSTIQATNMVGTKIEIEAVAFKP
jgi:2-iminobutanoate/2-iminopropanoate deaminase